MLEAMTDRPVLFVAYSGVLGGAERVLLDVVTRLERPAVIACPEGPLADAIRTARLPHTPIKARSPRLTPLALGHLFGLTYELTQRAREHDPAAIVAWGSRATMAAAMMTRRRRAPLLAVHHDLYPRPAVRGAVRAATRRADATAAASHAIAKSLGVEDVAVIHPGVDLDAYTPAPLPDGPPRALVVGALVGWKRPDLAVAIADRLPELHVTFAGEALPGETFERPERPNVTYAGRVADIRDALAGAHVLLHCADQEPFGLALIEALAAGRPVVAPDAAGPREIVTGREGRLYPPGDADAAARALNAVLQTSAAPAAARGRAEHFDVHDPARRFRDQIDVTILGALRRNDVIDITAS